MGQRKGYTGNPNGRPKGSTNRTTHEAKHVLNQVLFAEIDQIQNALSALRRDDPGKYLDVLAKLMKFVLPAQTSNEININTLTEPELDKLCDSLIQKFNDHEPTDQ